MPEVGVQVVQVVPPRNLPITDQLSLVTYHWLSLADSGSQDGHWTNQPQASSLLILMGLMSVLLADLKELSRIAQVLLFTHLRLSKSYLHSGRRSSGPICIGATGHY